MVLNAFRTRIRIMPYAQQRPIIYPKPEPRSRILFGPVPSDDFMPVFLILLDHRTSGKVALSGEPKSRGATTLSRVVPLLYGIP